ncbi:MAG: hypothetical protein C0168_08720 [Candidatus Aminicenantes bacterium]|nr:MAG: hypothetical protein C0168_08720 [Candidatus Aminicenantes bacterium]
MRGEAIFKNFFIAKPFVQAHKVLFYYQDYLYFQNLYKVTPLTIFCQSRPYLTLSGLILA